jgi:hypothetical protein
VKLGVSWDSEMLVCPADMGLEFLESQASNGQHRTRSTLSTYNCILNNARLHRSNRESLFKLASQAGIEKPFDGFVGVVRKLFQGARCCNDSDDSRDNTLEVAGSSRKLTAKFAGSQVGDVTSDQLEILNQLSKPDKRE